MSAERDKQTIARLRRELRLANRLGNWLYRGLDFYADPDTYFAVAVIADRPSGGFADDFSKVDGRVRPGKWARRVLDRCQKIAEKAKADE